jgi:hypothetical protein
MLASAYTGHAVVEPSGVIVPRGDAEKRCGLLERRGAHPFDEFDRQPARRGIRRHPLASTLRHGSTLRVLG